MNLFQKKTFEMHSGGTSDFKIECDALTDEDIATLAHIISQKFTFGMVYGVPTGGTRLATELRKHLPEDQIEGDMLIVDDVLTTGKSMQEARDEYIRVRRQMDGGFERRDAPKVQGVVIFARGECPDWIYPLFRMSD